MSKKEKAKQDKQKWVLTVVCLSFALSIVMSFVTSIFLQSAGIFLAVLSLIVLVLIGIITDIIGMAVASANEQPFIAMASKRISGAKQALQLIRKAERVSSLLAVFEGETPLYIFFEDTKKLVLAPQKMWVQPNDVMMAELEKQLGEKKAVIVE